MSNLDVSKELIEYLHTNDLEVVMIGDINIRIKVEKKEVK